jgi:hypothetical protein
MPYAHFSGYFTEKFWDDHVYEGEELAKKQAEQVFQRRDVAVSTVLQMDRHALRSLVAEVMQRQAEYAAAPRDTFVSRGQYAYWERSGKRAKRQGPSRFRYGVKKDGDAYKIHHFDGVE